MIDRILIKVKQLYTMVKKLKQLTFFEQIMSSIAIFVATSILGGGLLMWRSIAVQGQQIETAKEELIYIKENYVKNDFKLYLDSQFGSIKELIINDREEIKEVNNKIDKHLGIK